MPTKEEKMVDLDTSGEGAEINLEEQKDESVVETEAPKQETEEAPSEEPVETKQEETKEEPKKDDDQLKIIVKVFRQGLQNLHVKCVKLKGKEMQPLNMQNQLKKKDKLWKQGLKGLMLTISRSLKRVLILV
jgi:hypothetical protein